MSKKNTIKKEPIKKGSNGTGATGTTKVIKEETKTEEVEVQPEIKEVVKEPIVEDKPKSEEVTVYEIEFRTSYGEFKNGDKIFYGRKQLDGLPSVYYRETGITKIK